MTKAVMKAPAKLDKAQLAVDAMMVESRSNPRLFADMLLASMGHRVFPHAIHRIIQDLLEACLVEHRNICIQAPPEHGKSTQIIPALIYLLGHNQKLKIGFTSRDKDLIEEHLSKVRKYLLNNVCRSVFPNLKPDYKLSAVQHGEWSKTKLYLEGEEVPAFEIYPLLGRCEGHRLDCIWIDDAVTRECLYSEAERFRVDSAIFDTFSNRLTGKGILIVTNNCWHKDDAIHKMRQSPSYTTLWIGYADTLSINYSITNPPESWLEPVSGQMPLWDGVWDQERLEKKRGEPGMAWKRMFQGLTVAPEGALWDYETIEKNRLLNAPQSLSMIVVAVDPAITSIETSNETGIVVCAKDNKKPLPNYYVLEDASVRAATPDKWGRVAIAAYNKWKADKIIVETNQGGEMVSHTIRTIDSKIPIQEVHASRGKRTRAEPISALSEQGRLHHAGYFDALEEQLCSWAPGMDSPDRLDAMVWGISSILEEKRGYAGGGQSVY